MVHQNDLKRSGAKTHNGQDVVDPSVPNPECDKAKDKRRNRNTQRDHDGPDTHIATPFLPKERLRDDTGADRGSRADEEGCNRTTETHGRVRVCVGTANVADQTADQGDDEDGSATVALRQGAPEERCYTEDANDQGGEVASCLDFDLQVLGDIHKGGHDCCCGEGSHHGVESDQDEIRDFLLFLVWSVAHWVWVYYRELSKEEMPHLLLRPVIWVGIGHVGDRVHL